MIENTTFYHVYFTFFEAEVILLRMCYQNVSPDYKLSEQEINFTREAWNYRKNEAIKWGCAGAAAAGGYHGLFLLGRKTNLARLGKFSLWTMLPAVGTWLGMAVSIGDTMTGWINLDQGNVPTRPFSFMAHEARRANPNVGNHSHIPLKTNKELNMMWNEIKHTRK
jgi:hypothetical protein